MIPARLHEVSDELRSLYIQYSSAAQMERQMRVERVVALISQGMSVAAAEREADAHCLTVDLDLKGLKGELLALEEERDHLRFCVKWGQ
jgi:hypothetical protein